MPANQTAYLASIAALTAAVTQYNTVATQVLAALNAAAALNTANQATIATLTEEVNAPVDTSGIDAATVAITSQTNALLAATQVATSVTVSPSNDIVINGGTGQLTATVLDQNGTALVSQPSGAVFSLEAGAAGTITSDGLYTAPSSGSGTDTVSVAVGSLTGGTSVNY